MTVMTVRQSIHLALIGGTLAWAGPVFGQTGAADGEWRFYAGDGGHTQYTALDQIDRDNVADLEVAWRWQAENSAESPFYNFESTHHNPASPRGRPNPRRKWKEMGARPGAWPPTWPRNDGL